MEIRKQNRIEIRKQSGKVLQACNMQEVPSTSMDWPPMHDSVNVHPSLSQSLQHILVIRLDCSIEQRTTICAKVSSRLS
jgi:hypothetical protein